MLGAVWRHSEFRRNYHAHAYTLDAFTAKE
jgi:hypothetical protein